jgi:hypothetical protein
VTGLAPARFKQRVPTSRSAFMLNLPLQHWHAHHEACYLIAR